MMQRKQPMKRGEWKRKAPKRKAAPLSLEGTEGDVVAAEVASWPSMRRSKLKPRSEKMARIYAGGDGVEGRRDFVARLLRERRRCEAGARIVGMLVGRDVVAVGGPIAAVANGETGEIEVASGVALNARAVHACHGLAVDVHELLARSAGGSILDEANCIVVCRSCHDWIGQHPREALSLDLRRSRYAREG